MNRKNKNSKLSGAVLVIGGGVGGIQSALDLAGAGFKVHMAESSPAIGGNMAMLDKTFPTNDCSLCILSPKLVECGRNENINIMTLADVVGLTGEAGNFRAKILRRARYVDLEKCTGCGVCLEKCPRKYVTHPYLPGVETAKGKMSPQEWQLRVKAAIARPYAQALPNAPAIDCRTCLKLTKGTCGVCQKVCQAAAIRYDDRDRMEEIEVGAVIFAPGYEKFAPYPKLEYGYSRFPDVVTGMEFERILSASGPYSGHVCCPSDGRVPKRVAFLQCVGSRDISCRNSYCSSVCCMYAIKQAIIGREHLPGLESVVFNMDVRAFGKDFDKYYERARKEYGVRFERARVHSVEQNAGEGKEGNDGKKLAVSFSPQSGGINTENFDMVVLSVGLEPPAAMGELARGLGIRLNPHGFVWTDSVAPLRTSREGVFVAGVACGPKDIPETVMQASGAAAEAGRLLAGARMNFTGRKKTGEVAVKAGPVEEPRIGVIVCHCGINIAAVVGVEDVAKYAQTLPHVVHAETSLYACSQEAQKHIFALIEKHKLNRLVVASCSPRTHEPLFQATMLEAGLNPHLFEMANIRDQCSWIHGDDAPAATLKARDLVRMGVAKVTLAEQLYPISLPVTQSALVIGGGVAGMTCALAIADQGFKVYLLEKSKQFGGNLHNLDRTIAGKSTRALAEALAGQVSKHKLIVPFLGAQLHDIHGYVGNYTSTILSAGGKNGKKEIKHGAVVVAVGAAESSPREYNYGNDPRVMTQLEFEKKLSSASFKPPESVVMIQCVGSREDNRMYCSRVCCSTALKNAIRLRKASPGTKVTILYRDLRSYGFLEEYFTRCRDLGVGFVRFDPEKEKPLVRTVGKAIKVSVIDEILGEKIEIPAGLLVLSARVDPNPDNELLSKMLKVPLNADRFFLEAHVKLRPVDFATEGVFVAGTAHCPKSIEETISQANAAAARVCTIISKNTIESEPIIACVNEDMCDGCGVCAPVCDYGALEVTVRRDSLGVERKMVKVTEALCKGCGGCVAACPSGAMEQKGFKNKQILAMIDAALK